MEEIDFILESTEESMIGSIAHLEKEFLNIRAGKASPQMLGSVFVDYYGSQTPLSQVSNVNMRERLPSNPMKKVCCIRLKRRLWLPTLVLTQ
jgi:ribosome recycling factor